MTICLVLLCEITSAQRLCAKIDFNHIQVPDFRLCQYQRFPALVPKDYSLHREVPRYRSTSQFYLSNNYLDVSCIETDKPLKFDRNSFIEIAIYLRAVGNAYVEVTVFDASNTYRIKTIRVDNTLGWVIRREYIPIDILNARVRKKFI